MAKFEPDRNLIVKIGLRSIGILGSLVFGMLLYFTFSVPGYVEEIGKEFIKNQIEKETNQRIENFTTASKDNDLIKLAEKLYQGNQEEIDTLKRKIKDKVHEQMASVVAEMRDLDCECRQKHADMYESGFEFKIGALQLTDEKLKDFMRTKYMEVSIELKKDLRIFAGSNLFVFLLLLLLSFMKPKAITHLAVPAALLTISTLVCSYFYVFEQNWFLTIIYSDYMGLVFLLYVLIVFLFLCDIALNRGRVTTKFLNVSLDMVGSVGSISPC